MGERKKPNYTEEFKKKIVELHNSGKPAGEIIEEYGISNNSLYKWTKYYNNSGSFKVKDNRNEQQKELLALRKRNKQLEMENDILKQAALIMGRKSES